MLWLGAGGDDDGGLMVRRTQRGDVGESRRIAGNGLNKGMCTC